MGEYIELPLESRLLQKLPLVGIDLGRRIYFEEIQRLAQEDDRVNEMLGMMTREDYKKIEEMPFSPQTISLWALSAQHLTDAQSDSGYDSCIAFKRTGVKSPWKVVYKATREDKEDSRYPKGPEFVDVFYEGESLFFMGDSYVDGSMDVSINIVDEEIEEDFPFMVEALKKIKNLERTPFDLDVIANSVVKFIGEF